MNKIDPVIIKNDNIELIPISCNIKKYVDDFHEYSTKKEFFKYLTFEPFLNYDESKNYIKKLIKRSSVPNCQYWFIKLKKKNKVIGSIGLLNYEFISKSVEIGYGISPDYWGKGIFKNSAELLIDFFSSKFAVNSFLAKTSIENRNSISALKKLGFKESSIISNYYEYTDGHIEDAQIMILYITR